MNHQYQAALANQEELSDPIFVGGCPRSGTTLLARIIALSDNIAYVEEPGLFGSLYVRRAPLASILPRSGNQGLLRDFPLEKLRHIRDICLGKDILQEIVVALVKHTELFGHDLKPSASLVHIMDIKLSREKELVVKDLCRKYQKLSRINQDTMLRTMLKDFQIMSRRDNVLEKTPANIFYLPLIRRVFNSARIILIKRNNMRDVIASYFMLKGDIDRKSIPHIITTYNKADTIWKEYSALGLPNCLTIIYEDLLEHPDKVVEYIYKFLSLPVPEQIRDQIKDVKPQNSKWDQLPSSQQKYINKLIAKSCN